jgi:hypothetical protein
VVEGHPFLLETDMPKAWLAAVGSVLVCVTLAAAPVRDVPVISIVDGDGPGDLTQTFQSDGLGPYVHTAKGSSGVESHIQAGGDYELDLYYFTSNRRLSYRFAPENLVGGSALASGLITTQGRLIMKCGSSTNNMTTMVEGATLHCPMAGRFDWNNRAYLTRMGGVGYPNSTLPTIACTGTSGGTCAAWTISSCQQPTDPETGSCDNAGVMTILEERTVKGKVTETWVGDFTMHFRIAATKQQ